MFFQLWRLITTFLFFGNMGFNFLFNMIFTYRYCRMLEEGSFRRRTADFVMMFIFGGICMIVSFQCFIHHFLRSIIKYMYQCISLYVFILSLLQTFAFFVNLLFLGHAFTIMLVYVWSRRNPFVRLNFFGLLNFQVSFLFFLLYRVLQGD